MSWVPVILDSSGKHQIIVFFRFPSKEIAMSTPGAIAAIEIADPGSKVYVRSDGQMTCEKPFEEAEPVGETLSTTEALIYPKYCDECSVLTAKVDSIPDPEPPYFEGMPKIPPLGESAWDLIERMGGAFQSLERWNKNDKVWWEISYFDHQKRLKLSAGRTPTEATARAYDDYIASIRSKSCAAPNP